LARQSQNFSGSYVIVIYKSNVNKNRNQMMAIDVLIQNFNHVQNVGPILILCSEDDDLAPYSVVSDFAKHLEERGADVRLAIWNSSRHVCMS
jgi:acetyl esterase/lipase